ncbi:MAG: hypothetical protein K0S46_1746 [Moraxellaceae bacterium]|jgi:putative restriction endonuclease|nr:hypothetical protein [Moraxellaceae bacterium]
MSLQTYVHKFQSLKVNVAHGRASPHKICMLLALLDLARSGGLVENKVVFGPALLERYEGYFAAVRTEQDHANPYFPFFHLAGDLRGGESSFWRLTPLPGRELVLQSMKSATSYRAITDNIAWASLDDELFHLLQDEKNIDALSEALAGTWFNRGLDDLKAVAERGKQISRYERQIRGLTLSTEGVREQPRTIRDPAFRRVVTEIYDYRCAATGVRILLPDGRAMVEAAHILPHAISSDDDPRNGLALTPDMHWAMDNNLIAPGPDFCWHVSRTKLDDRIPDHRAITELEGRNLILPKNIGMYPKRDALEWRIRQLN